MKANYRQSCPKCHLTILVGEEIKPHFVYKGRIDGKAVFQRGQGYVHKTCPKINKNTGEVA